MLIARINAIFRRVDQINTKGSSISFGDLEINTLTYIAKLEDNELHLLWHVALTGRREVDQKPWWAAVATAFVPLDPRNITVAVASLQ